MKKIKVFIFFVSLFILKTVYADEIADAPSLSMDCLSADVLMSKSQKKERANLSFQEYFDKYFPKAYIIRDFFKHITVAEIDQALRVIVEVLSQEPLVYFTNPRSPFKISHYWEHIVDQLSLMSEFLENAHVNVATGVITISEKNDWFGGFCGKNDEESLASVLCGQNINSFYYAFYALCFDYCVKLFNEGILLLDIKQTVRYYQDLEYVVEKMRGSDYEKWYQEHLKTAQELMNLLKQILGVQDDVLELGSFGRNKKWGNRNVFVA